MFFLSDSENLYVYKESPDFKVLKGLSCNISENCLLLKVIICNRSIIWNWLKCFEYFDEYDDNV